MEGQLGGFGFAHVGAQSQTQGLGISGILINLLHVSLLTFSLSARSLKRPFKQFLCYGHNLFQ